MSSIDNHHARLVVTGVGANGRSTVVSDSNSTTRVVTPTFAVGDVWRLNSVPVEILSDSTLDGNVVLEPPRGGLLVRTVAFAPDREWQESGDYKEAMAAISGGDSHEEDEHIVGLHATDTVDIGTVISGEVYAVLQDAEVLLRQGDSLIQRGTKHAWSNRSDKPAVVVFTQISANR